MLNSQKFIESLDIIGTKVHVGTLTEYVDTIIGWAMNRKCSYVCVANTHMLVVAKQKSSFHRVLSSSNLIVPDGGPLVTKIKLNGYKFQERAAGYDLTLKIMSMCEKLDLPIGFFGSSNSELEKCKTEVVKLFPDLRVNLLLAPPIFDDLHEVEYLLNQIQEAD
jgi:N-acetylglucosaminyldiphosphoundecaprenol N-acetyl-beta-D-mannosaminyltransferase